MKKEETIESLLALVRFYKKKIDKGTLTGSEGSTYIKALLLLGLKDASIKTRNLEDINESVEIVNLPFQQRG